MQKHVPLSSVTIDITGQNNKKGAKVKDKKRAASTLSVWSINLTSQSSSLLW